MVAGTEISGCHTVELSSSNFGQASSFFVQVVGQRNLLTDVTPWYAANTIDISIQMGFLPDGLAEGALTWQELMSGRVDRVRIDPVAGLISLDGRDYAGKLLDLPVTESFLNRTSSDVAQQLATRSGLFADVDQTRSLIGQYYQIEHARVALSRFSRFGTAWDLLSNLAQLEGYELWVQGSTMFFKSPDSVEAAVHSIDFTDAGETGASPTLNVTSLLVERSLALSGGLPVMVSSWNSRQRQRVTAKAGSSKAGAPGQINVVRPNLVPDAAQSLADGVLLQTAGHERSLSATMPGDLVMSPRDKVRITGIGGGWDGEYRLDTVDREMTLAGGFVQRFTAKTLSA